jgi:3-phosphoshikimate 1-carboxyvinyltransferase
MTNRESATRSLRAQRPSALAGRFAAAADPEVAAMALLAAASARGESGIGALPAIARVRIFEDAVRALGAQVERRPGGSFVAGLGAGGLLAPEAPIALEGEAGATDLLAGALGVYPFTTHLTRPGPLSPGVREAMRLMGARPDQPGPDLLAITGPRTAVPGRCDCADEATTTALLFAALATPGTTTISQSAGGFPRAIAVLRAFGARIEVEEWPAGGRRIAIAGLPDLRGIETRIPGDPLAAAMALVTGLITRHADLVVENVPLGDRGAGFIETMLEMGGDLRITAETTGAGLRTAEVRVRHSRLRGIAIEARRTRELGDTLPFVLVAAGFAEGETRVAGLDASDAAPPWVGAMTRGLAANHVQWQARTDGLAIHGQGRVSGGGLIPAHPDPRIPLSFLAMGLGARDPITVVDDTPVASRFPDLLAGLGGLGAKFRREGST